MDWGRGRGSEGQEEAPKLERLKLCSGEGQHGETHGELSFD